MKIAGIIAEYNPFHNGHMYQIEQTRKLGATHIACVMSGSFVQRGDVAVFSKWARAKAAILNGADLVVEMPTVFSLSAASDFAKAGVFVLSALKADLISFGSETANIDSLTLAAKCMAEAENSDLILEFLKEGYSYPMAKQKAIELLFSKDVADLFLSPNNLLAIEYINALNKQSAKITPMAVKRINAEHDTNLYSDNICSAFFIRELILNGEINKLYDFVPESAAKIYKQEIEEGKAPLFLKNEETTVLYKLRSLSKDDFASLCDVSEGLENRLYDAAQKACSIEEFLSLVKTKRYTMARLRRILAFILLDIKKEDKLFPFPYIRVLAMNDKGKEILAKAKSDDDLLITSKFANIYKVGGKMAEIDKKATDFLSLLQSEKQSTGVDFTNNVIITK